jgi:small subunit ribosomal protein S24e
LSNADLSEKIAKMYKVDDKNTIVLFGFKSQFGGGKSSGFCSIYDNIHQLKKVEPRFVLVRKGLATKIEKSRKQTKERKNRAAKFFGKEKVAKMKGTESKKE